MRHDVMSGARGAHGVCADALHAVAQSGLFCCRAAAECAANAALTRIVMA
jgi:hypothetical protein